MKKKLRNSFIAVWFENFGAMVPLNILNSTLLMMLAPYGIASVGMTKVSIDITKNHYYTSIVDYFLAIAKCWKQALIAGVINLVITALLIASLFLYHIATGFFTTVGFYLSAVALAVFSFMKYYIWTQIVLIDLPLKSIYKNAYYFAFINLKKNIIIGFVSLVFYAIAVVAMLYIPYPILTWVFLFVLGCFFPGFKHLLVQWHVYPFIKTNMIDVYHEKQASCAEGEENKRADNQEE